MFIVIGCSDYQEDYSRLQLSTIVCWMELNFSLPNVTSLYLSCLLDLLKNASTRSVVVKIWLFSRIATRVQPLQECLKQAINSTYQLAHIQPRGESPGFAPNLQSTWQKVSGLALSSYSTPKEKVSGPAPSSHSTPRRGIGPLPLPNIHNYQTFSRLRWTQLSSNIFWIMGVMISWYLHVLNTPLFQ